MSEEKTKPSAETGEKPSPPKTTIPKDVEAPPLVLVVKGEKDRRANDRDSSKK